MCLVKIYNPGSNPYNPGSKKVIWEKKKILLIKDQDLRLICRLCESKGQLKTLYYVIPNLFDTYFS